MALFVCINRVTLYVVATDQTLTPFACHVAKKYYKFKFLFCKIG